MKSWTLKSVGIGKIPARTHSKLKVTTLESFNKVQTPTEEQPKAALWGVLMDKIIVFTFYMSCMLISVVMEVEDVTHKRSPHNFDIFSSLQSF